MTAVTRKLMTASNQFKNNPGYLMRGSALIRDLVGKTNTLLGSIVDFNKRTSRVLGVPRQFIMSLANNARQAIESFNDYKYQVGAYSALRGTIDGLSFAVLSTFSKSSFAGVFTQWDAMKKAAGLVLEACVTLYGVEKLFAESTATKFDDKRQAYIGATTGGNLQSSQGSKTNLANVAPPGSTKIARVFNTDTVQSLAQRELGDAARYKELILLNNLRAPYFSATGDGVTVLRPGVDEILLPSTGVSNSSNASVTGAGVTNATTVVPDLTTQKSLLVNRLVRDLQLIATKNGGGDAVYDITISSSGDFEYIEGVDNLNQAILIKFSTEQGDLPTHPTFGLQVPIGTKMLIPSLVAYQIGAQTCLLADSRISKVSSLQFSGEGNVLSIKASLNIASTDQMVGVSFEARR
jgi:hypothetical protein